MGHYRVTLKDFGEGVVTCIGTYVEVGPYRGSGKGRPKPDRARPETAERWDSSVRRSRRTLREKVLMLRADRMLTLTKRGRIESLDDAWLHWKEFSRLARKFWGARWQFVVVPESHEAGGFHLHVALNGYYDVGMLRRLWSRALGGTGHERGIDTLGNVDIRAAASSPRSRTRIAGYLSKYLGKDAGAVLRGRRALASSRAIPSPDIQRWQQTVSLAGGPIGEAMRRIRGFVSTRLVGLGWWEWRCGALHGFGISPL